MKVAQGTKENNGGGSLRVVQAVKTPFQIVICLRSDQSQPKKGGGLGGGRNFNVGREIFHIVLYWVPRGVLGGGGSWPGCWWDD